jgi:acetyl esterase/lipase
MTPCRRVSSHPPRGVIASGCSRVSEAAGPICQSSPAAKMFGYDSRTRDLYTLLFGRNQIVGFVIRAAAGILVLTLALFAVAAASAAEGVSEIELWPGGLPADAVPLEESKIAKLKSQPTEERIHYVDRPTLTAFTPSTELANGCAVVICPGGGYNILAWPKEGTEVAEWFNSIGVTAFVLKYRVPRRGREAIHWEPMQDVQRAIRVVRQQADKWNIDPTRIGTLGFSAGGHLTVMSGVQYETESYPRVDDADDLSCRPDFICPIYAAYLADGYRDDVVELGSLVKVTDQTPPTFMAVTWDDKMRGAQAALLFARLKEHGVPAELHVYSKGGHGYGIRASDNPVSTWHHHLGVWLKASGLLAKVQLTDSISQPER